jgi:hypothetical protein
MDQLRAMVPGYDFAVVPTARFNGNHFRVQPDEAKELGCTPDYNAWTLAENKKPDNKTTMRTASGHVHIGFCEGADPGDKDHQIRCSTLMKQMDFYLGLPSLLWDGDKSRRSMYGKAGCFRPKPYGAEYRVLSNAWLLDDKRIRFVFRNANKAVQALLAGNRPAETIGQRLMENTINTSDVRSARNFLSRYDKDLYNETLALIGEA